MAPSVRIHVEGESAPGAAPIQVQQLQGLDYNGFGTLDESHGGLPTGFWSGTDATVAAKLLSILTPSASRPLESLIRRLLLSVATPPATAVATAVDGESLVVRRAQALWTLGRADDLADLLKSLPLPAITPPLRRLRADAALLVGDTATACAEAAPLAAASATDPFPVELRVFCQFVAGQNSAAGLGIDVLREQGNADPGFLALADALLGAAPAKSDGLDNPSPLLLAMARLAKVSQPPPAPGATPMVLRAIALVPSAPLDIRLAAGERAEAIGALDTDTLRRLYETVPFTNDDLANAETKAAALPEPRAHALLCQAAEHQTTPLGKAGLIARALNSVDGPGFFVQADIYAALIATLQPGPDIALYAPILGRAMLAAHQVEGARPWIGWIRAQATADKSAEGAAAALAVDGRLAQLVDGALDPGTLSAWSRAGAGLPADRAARRVALGLALLAAVGDAVPPEAWAAQIDGGTPVATQVPSPALALGLDAAVSGKRVGEIILYAYAMLGDGTLTQTDVASLVRVVTALKSAGFDDEARALALEAALANGA